MNFGLRNLRVWRLVLLACVMVFVSPSFSFAQVSKSTKKVTVTLVRWPYT
jgi:hypothetical protein